MIYVDSSVALAYLLAEPRSPPAGLWRESLSSSVLLEYEIWNSVNALGRSTALANEILAILNRITLIEMDRAALAQALKPWPVPVRTLDGLHMSTMIFVREQGEPVALASYDNRLIGAAQALGFAIAAL